MSNLSAPQKSKQPGSILRRWWPVWLVLLATLLMIPWLVGPACPKKITMATGSREGAYYAFAQQYQQKLAEHGITVNLIETTGSVDNISRLSASPEVSLAIVQGGCAQRDTESNLESLASLYLEPMWVFYRGGESLDSLEQLRGRRIAVGQSGSGTRQLAMKLLAENKCKGRLSVKVVPNQDASKINFIYPHD